jgi:hypothetical protein
VVTQLFALIASFDVDKFDEKINQSLAVTRKDNKSDGQILYSLNQFIPRRGSIVRWLGLNSSTP